MLTGIVDVQYGDSFRVEAYWNVSAISNDRVRLTISAGVAFLKKIHMPGVTGKTLTGRTKGANHSEYYSFEGMIRSKSIEETTNSFVLWTNVANEEIERREKESTDQGKGVVRKVFNTSQLSKQSNADKEKEKEKAEKHDRTESQPLVVSSSSTTTVSPPISPISCRSNPAIPQLKPVTSSSLPIITTHSAGLSASDTYSLWTSPQVVLVFLATVLILCLAILWKLGSISTKLEKIEALILMSAQNVAAVAGAAIPPHGVLRAGGIH